jgi:hypothetical protein
MKGLLAAAAVITAAVIGVLAMADGPARATTAPPTVTAITVTPAPFYWDEPRMKVTFRTLKPAAPGYLYFLFWQTFATRSSLPPGCSPSSNIEALGYKGGSNIRVTAIVTPERIFGDAFCPGPSELRIFTQLAKPNRTMSPRASARTYRLAGKLSFRVQRP